MLSFRHFLQESVEAATAAAAALKSQLTGTGDDAGFIFPDGTIGRLRYTDIHNDAVVGAHLRWKDVWAAGIVRFVGVGYYELGNTISMAQARAIHDEGSASIDVMPPAVSNWEGGTPIASLRFDEDKPAVAIYNQVNKVVQTKKPPTVH